MRKEQMMIPMTRSSFDLLLDNVLLHTCTVEERARYRRYGCMHVWRLLGPILTLSSHLIPLCYHTNQDP
jgi:hypothetical protein